MDSSEVWAKGIAHAVLEAGSDIIDAAGGDLLCGIIDPAPFGPACLSLPIHLDD